MYSHGWLGMQQRQFTGIKWERMVRRRMRGCGEGDSEEMLLSLEVGKDKYN